MVMLGPTAISIHNNKLYIITGEIPGLGQDTGGMYVVNLANADQYGFDMYYKITNLFAIIIDLITNGLMRLLM